MEINSRFRIAVRHVSSNGETKVETVLATDFFDCDDYDESEWGCDLPWRHTGLDQYLPQTATNVQSISVSITDTKTDQQRIVHVQYLECAQLILSWEDCTSKPGQFEIILDSPLEVGTRIARLDVHNGVVSLTSHLLVAGDQVKSLLSEE